MCLSHSSANKIFIATVDGFSYYPLPQLILKQGLAMYLRLNWLASRSHSSFLGCSRTEVYRFTTPEVFLTYR